MAMTPQEGVLGHVAANTPAPSFTTDQYQQLLALIGALPQPSQQHIRAGVPHGQYRGFP